MFIDDDWTVGYLRRSANWRKYRFTNDRVGGPDSWPTNQDVLDATAAVRRGMVLDILRGRVSYRGLCCEPDGRSFEDRP
jgi:hypothetical protein